MEETRRPPGLTIGLAAFGAVFVLNALTFGAHMLPVWYYRARPALATQTVLQCQRERLTEARCYQASEALNPLPAPALARWFAGAH